MTSPTSSPDRFKDLNRPADADPELWLDRRDATAMQPDERDYRVICTFKERERLVVTPAMRNDLRTLAGSCMYSRVSLCRLVGLTPRLLDNLLRRDRPQVTIGQVEYETLMDALNAHQWRIAA